MGWEHTVSGLFFFWAILLVFFFFLDSLLGIPPMVFTRGRWLKSGGMVGSPSGCGGFLEASGLGGFPLWFCLWSVA